MERLTSFLRSFRRPRRKRNSQHTKSFPLLSDNTEEANFISYVNFTDSNGFNTDSSEKKSDQKQLNEEVREVSLSLPTISSYSQRTMCTDLSFKLNGNRSRTRNISECSLISEVSESDLVNDPDEDDSYIVTDLEPIDDDLSAYNNYYYRRRSIYLKKYNKFKHLDCSLVKMPENIVKVKFKDRKEYIIDELIETEKCYIQSLALIFENYKDFVLNRLGEKLTKNIFCNLELIYTNTISFLNDLEASRDDYDKIGQMFIKNKSLFELYPKYCINKRYADELCNQHEELLNQRKLEIQDKNDLSLQLYRPIERLTKYSILLKSLSKQLQKDKLSSICVSRAIKVINCVLSKANDKVALDSIKGHQFETRDTGNLIFCHKFKMLAARRPEVTLFLFRKKIIVTTKDPKEKAFCCYQSDIDLKKACFDEEPYNEKAFTLLHYTVKGQPPLRIRVDAKDSAIKQQWVDELKRLLWMQLYRDKEEAKRRNSFVF